MYLSVQIGVPHTTSQAPAAASWPRVLHKQNACDLCSWFGLLRWPSGWVDGCVPLPDGWQGFSCWNSKDLFLCWQLQTELLWMTSSITKPPQSPLYQDVVTRQLNWVLHRFFFPSLLPPPPSSLLEHLFMKIFAVGAKVKCNVLGINSWCLLNINWEGRWAGGCQKSLVVGPFPSPVRGVQVTSTRENFPRLGEE